jgi:hypothetical protein
MKPFLIFFLSLIILTVKGQVTNSTCKNGSNIYVYSVDTLVSMILKKEKQIKIFIVSDDFILNRLPDTISNQNIFKKKKLKGTKDFEGAIWINIDRLNIDSGKVAIFTSIRKQTNKQMLCWESGIGSYTLKYDYDLKSNTYILIDILKGMIIR